MRILQLGANTASQMDVTVAALRRIGVEARGLCLQGNSIQSADSIEVFGQGEQVVTLPAKLSRMCLWWKTVSGAIRWADVVHCYVGPRVSRYDLDLWYISRKKKGRLVEFLGSDIRTENVAACSNPYLQALLLGGEVRYAITDSVSRNRQLRYARYGFRCATSDPELEQCVMRDLFPSHYVVRARVDMSRFEAAYPRPEKRRPLLVHMSSNAMLKGTSAVLEAVRRLRERFEFDFRLLQGLEHGEALRVLRSCDLMLDQFVIGTHGVASIEAMAFGKPVVGYIKPAYISRLPPEFPVVPATQDNLAQVVAALLGNASRLNTIGRLSRAYVEKYHSADVIARQLLSIYNDLQTNPGEGQSVGRKHE